LDDETNQPEHTNSHQHKPNDRLSARWALILAISAGIGWAVGSASGVDAGLMAGIAIAGLLFVAVGS
jgi:hypothetical protein